MCNHRKFSKIRIFFGTNLWFLAELSEGGEEDWCKVELGSILPFHQASAKVHQSPSRLGNPPKPTQAKPPPHQSHPRLHSEALECSSFKINICPKSKFNWSYIKSMILFLFLRNVPQDNTFHEIDNPKKSRYLSNKGERRLSPGGSNSIINLASKLEKELFVKFSKPRGIWNEIRHLSHFLSNPDRRTILGCQNFLSFMVQFKYATVSWYCRLKTYIYW